MNCASCGRANRAAARFCGGCGGSLAPRCPACGVESEAGAQFCDACGASLTARASDEAVARKVVTIVFADLVGSTSLHERLDAESARRLMDRYYRALHAAVEAHGGTVVKLLGDGVMAAFGVPHVAEDDAIRAVRAAFGMQQAFRELAHGQAGVLGDVGLRVAVNTGEVVVSDDHTDVVGDPVNVAAHLQQRAQDGEVLIGEPTRRLVGELVTLAPFGSLTLKGRSETVAAYRVVSLDRPAGAAATVFVGRDDELRRIMTIYDAAVAARGARLAVILGSPGLGKSRLLDEFARRLGDEATAVIARCDAAVGATFAPLAGALRAFLRLEVGASAEAARAAIEAVVPGDEPERARIADGITALLAATPASPEETFFVVRRFLGAIAAAQPVVLVIDDLQWAEPLLLDLTEHLVQWSTAVPLLVLVAARPELRDVRSSLTAPGGLVADVVTLGGLDADAATRLAANVIGAGALPAAVAGRVLATSEGNPLFVGELVRMLVQDGVLKREGDRWIAGVELAALEMPPTIHALLAARIERLRPEERTVLERAAVVGRQFSRTAVAHLLPREIVDLDARLESLRRSELIEPDAGWFLGEPVLRFHHVLIRDAAYRRLLKGTRAELHGRFADWIETRVGEILEHDETIGWHLEQAHQLLSELGPIDTPGRAFGERAARYLAAAGRRALSRDDLTPAASLLGRALARLDAADPARADLAVDWCEALLAAGDVAPAVGAVDELARFTGASDRLRAWHTCFAGQLAVLTDPETLRSTADAVAIAADELASLGDAAGEAKAHSVHALALGRLGKVGASEAALDRALAAARRAHDRRRANAVLAGAPVAALWGPSPVTRASGRCLDVVRVLRITQGAPAVEAVALRCQAVLEALRGRTEAARRMIASSRHMVEELGITHRLLEADVFAGLIDLLEGDTVAAERCLRTAYDGLREHGLGIDAAQAAALLGRALLALGRAAEAEALSHESEALAGDDLKAAIAWRGVRAEALAQRGEAVAAVAFARAAVEIAAATDALLDHADARLALAAALRAAGRSDEADAEETRAIELWEAKGATLLAERARRNDRPIVETDRTLEHRAESARPVGRRVRPNAATANAARLDAAFAARDADACETVFADDAETVHHPTGTTYDRRGALAAVRSLFKAEDVTFVHEPLATLGDSLALCRMSWSASRASGGGFDVGAYENEQIVLIEVDARGQRRRTERFVSDRLDQAVARLYACYAGILPDGPARARAAATARSFATAAVHVPGSASAFDPDHFRTALAPDLEHVDRRTVGLGSTRGAQAFLRGVDALRQLSEDLTRRIDDILDLRSDALLIRFTTSGTDRASGGAFERPFLLLLAFGSDGLVSRWEQLDIGRDIEALARFAELTEPPTAPVVPAPSGAGKRTDRRVRPNAATANAARLDAAIAARNADALPELLADQVENVHHPTGVVYERRGTLAFWHSLLTARDVTFWHEPLATLGDSLALCHSLVSIGEFSEDAFGPRSAFASVGPVEGEVIVLIEVDAHGRRVRSEFFAEGHLSEAIARLYERYADLIPDGPARARAAATARSAAAILGPFELDRYAAAFAPAVEAVDHRTLGTWSARGADALREHFRSMLDLADAAATRDDEVLGLQPDGFLVRRTHFGTARTGGGAYERQFLVLWIFGADGLLTRMEWFDADRDAQARARFDELTVEPAGRRYAAAPPRAVGQRERRVRSNAATALSAGLDAAVAARDADAFLALFADDSEGVDYTTGTTWDRRGFLTTWHSLLRARDPTCRHEPLATFGESLALLRQSISASGFSGGNFDVGTYQREILIVSEVDAQGRHRRSESFASDRLGDAITRLYQRYADLLPDGPARVRAAATARSVAAMLGPFDPDRYAVAYAPTVEVVDHRTLGTWSMRGAEALLQNFRSWLELTDDTAVREDEILAAQSDAFLGRKTFSGTDRVGGGAFERPFIQLWAFGSDGLVTHLEFFDIERDAEALARFDALTAEPPASRFTNAASRTVDRFERCWRERDWDAVVAMYAPTHVLDDRRALVGLPLSGEDFFVNLRFLFAMKSSQWHSEGRATRGDRLVLTHTRFTGDVGDGAEIVVEFLSVAEVDAAGRYIGLVSFDLENLDAANAELDDRYAAGEGAPYAELLANNRAFRQASAARDWDAVARLLPADFTMINHRRFGGTGSRMNRDEYLAWRRSVDDLDVRGDMRVDHVLRISARAGVHVVTSYGTVDGGDFELPFVSVYTHDRSSFHSSELFDLEQLDVALARYDELAIAPFARCVEGADDPLRIPPNAATRTSDRWQDAVVARDWESVELLFASTLVFDDRRHGVLTTGDRQMLLANDRLIGESRPHVARTVLATAGDRLALRRVSVTGTSAAGAFEEVAFAVDFLQVIEVDADGRLVALIVFDPDDRRAASLEMLDRYARSDARRATHPGGMEFQRALHDHDLERCRAALSDPFVFHDHRRTGAGRIASVDQYIAWLAALFEQSADAIIEPLYYVAVGEHGFLTVGHTYGTLAEGGDFESVFVQLALHQGGRPVSAELFELEDLDVARARFEELRPNTLRIVPNAACRVRDRTSNAFAASDWAALRALASDDFVFDERRKRALIRGDVELWIENMRVMRASFGARVTRELIGTVGDRIVLDRVVVAGEPDTGAFEIELIALAEVDAEGRLVASITFDLEDRGAAFAEAQARFPAGEAAATGGQAPIAVHLRAIAQHDWETLRGCVADDAVVHDRRTLGMGKLGRDEWIESLRVLVDLAPDTDVEAFRILAWNRHGRVAMQRIFGALRDGGPFENVLVVVTLTGGDRIRRFEFFDVGDADKALARFEELCSDLP